MTETNQVAAPEPIQAAVTPPPSAVPQSAVMHIGQFIQAAVKAEVAKVQTVAVTTEHKVGAAILKYWPIAAGLVAAATRFI